MAQKLSALSTGSKVKLLTFLGAPVQWRVVGRSLTGMPSGSTTLIADKILALRCFDAKELKNTDSNRKNYGNNDYGVSNLRQWLNSSASAGNWYSAQHSSDAPPDTASNCGGYNAYQADKGFLAESAQRERDLLLATTRNYGGNTSNGKSCSDKVFLFTTNELGLETIANNGTKIPYFADNNSRITQCTSQCIADSDYSVSGGTSANWYYWTATSYPSGSFNVRLVSTSGTLDYGVACNGDYGVRPGCNLSSDILVSDSTDADGCYTIVFNQPPTAPTTLEVPTTIRSTKPIEIKWSAGTDPEGNLTGYILQRKLDSGQFGEIYRGSQRSYSDTVASGTTSVQYRVQSYDNQGQTSPWTTSGVRAVLNNEPPVINPGEISNETPGMEPPTLTYTVTDADGGNVTVVEYLDDEQIKSHTPELGMEQTITYDATKWLKVANGKHVYKIVATDDKEDSTSASVEFTKQVDSIDFTLTEPMECDERPSVALINAQGSFPAGCELKIELCNNALDEEPAWVDATSEAKTGMKVFLSNEEKTAEKWAVGIRFHLARNGAEGPVNIVSIGGNFQ